MPFSLTLLVALWMSAGGGSFFDTYPREARAACTFWEEHAEACATLCRELGAEDARRAAALVAPELAMFSRWGNFAQSRAMYILYIQTGSCDFSIGYFQMKPSFAEALEAEIARDPALSAKYGDLPIRGERPKTERRIRLERLLSLEGALRYLAAFVDWARAQSAQLPASDPGEILRIWATWYNAGIHTESAALPALRARKTFPRGQQGFNYAEVTAEFYHHLNLFVNFVPNATIH